MATGKVKWFNKDKKYGFIAQENGKDIFVHLNDIQGKRVLKEGQRVEFDIARGDKGPRATNVRVIE